MSIINKSAIGRLATAAATETVSFCCMTDSNGLAPARFRPRGRSTRQPHNDGREKRRRRRQSREDRERYRGMIGYYEDCNAQRESLANFAGWLQPQQGEREGGNGK